MELAIQGVGAGVVVGLILGWIIAATRGQGGMTIIDNLRLYFVMAAVGAIVGGIIGAIIGVVGFLLG